MSSKPKTPQDCKTQADFTRYAQSKGAEVVNGGRHVSIYYHGHRVPLGHANGELPIGTRKAIIRSLVAIGLGALLAALPVVVWRIGGG